jgi:D-arabinose 1-dehydrogenase-like Zn-dependent alcohol dehydrogenase
MKAVVLLAVGASLVVEDIPVPEPRAGEVLLRVRACGECHTDLHVVKGEVKFPVPAALGDMPEIVGLARRPNQRDPAHLPPLPA